MSRGACATQNRSWRPPSGPRAGPSHSPLHGWCSASWTATVRVETRTAPRALLHNAHVRTRHARTLLNLPDDGVVTNADLLRWDRKRGALGTERVRARAADARANRSYQPLMVWVPRPARARARTPAWCRLRLVHPRSPSSQATSIACVTRWKRGRNQFVQRCASLFTTITTDRRWRLSRGPGEG